MDPNKHAVNAVAGLSNLNSEIVVEASTAYAASSEGFRQ